MNLHPTGPPRKPLRLALADLEKQRGLEIQRGFDREVRIEEAMREAERLEGFPGIKALLQMVRESLPAGQFDHLPTDERELRRQALEQLVYSTPNIFVDSETISDGRASRLWKIWDFDQLLSQAITITKDCRPSGILQIWIDMPGDRITLEGSVADSFERYLVFLGTFSASSAKTPCPRCSQGVPTCCDVCGGLGWIMKPEAAL